MNGVEDRRLRDNARSLLNAVSDAVVAIDERGIVNFTNSAARSIFGYASEELLHQPVSMLVPEADRVDFQTYVERYLADGEATVTEVSAQTKNGYELSVSIDVSELVVAKESWFVGVVRDLNEQPPQQQSVIEQRERFAQINRLSTLGEMTVNIAHEINQPLAAIAMYAQASRRLLARDDIDKAKLISALEKLNTQALRAGEVIERIQYFMHSDSGVKVHAKINQVLREVRSLLEADVKASGIELELNLPKSSSTIVCDPSQIQQVLINLVRNAADAMNEIECNHGRVISINCDNSEAGVVVVEVVDQGPGIEEAWQSLIFDAFQTSKATGTGMGLSVSRSMIEHHKGDLNFSNNSDWGATFTFRLPSVAED